MLRVLRAFTWMRWRVLMNSLERTGTRDTLERLSLAAEQIGPLIAMGLMAPSALGLALLGGYAGYALVTAPEVLAFNAVRVLLGIATGFCVLGPIMMPSMERTSAVRLLLLPIPRPTLYLAQASVALSDPWILLSIPLLLGVAVGLAISGALVASLVAIAASVLLLLTLLGLSALGAFVLHLLVRDRRRGELVTLIVIMVLPMIGLLPSVLGPSGTRTERRAERQARAERLARGEGTRTERVMQAAGRAYTVLPSELAGRGIRYAVSDNAGAAMIPLGALAVTGGVFHLLAFTAFRRLLASPGTTSRRQAVADTPARRVRLPGLNRTEAAVALAQLRLALRTPRGQSILISPLIVFAMLGVLMVRQRQMDFGGWLSGGLGLASFGAAVCLLAILPFSVNQFAIDRAGLTLALLSPIDNREYLIGKAAGNALIAGLPTALCILIALVLFRDGSPAYWLGLIPALVATYAIGAPAAAALSAMLPRRVDLNSMGRGSNAHGLAAFAGMLVLAASALPSAVLTAIAIGVVKMPALAPVLLLAWCVVSLIVSRLLFGVVAKVFETRRENLALVTK